MRTMVRLILALGSVTALSACGQQEDTEEASPPAVIQSELCGRTIGARFANLVGDIELGCTGLNLGLSGRSATSLTTVVTPGGDITGSAAPLCSLWMNPPRS